MLRTATTDDHPASPATVAAVTDHTPHPGQLPTEPITDPTTIINTVEGAYRMAATNLDSGIAAARQHLHRGLDRMNAWNQIASAFLANLDNEEPNRAVAILVGITSAAQLRLTDQNIDHTSYPDLADGITHLTTLMANDTPPLDAWCANAEHLAQPHLGHDPVHALQELSDLAAAAIILLAQAPAPTSN